MILGPVSYLDCIIFCTFLTPQLILNVGLFETIWTVVQMLPFLVIQLPLSFIYDQFLVSKNKQSPFVQKATKFEDFVIRCVRYAFANIPPKVGRVFFSKKVALPFLRWRLLRHGYLRSPFHWVEYTDKKFKGVWAVIDPTRKADLVILYAHGGGFSMGSTYFYLEFLLSWLSLLKDAGYENPAVFGLDYTLVPDSSFPTQLEEVVYGYEHVVAMAGDPSIVCVSGDSAGATLILSLLLHLANPVLLKKGQVLPSLSQQLDKPGMAVLISPWPTLSSSLYKNNASDYLDAPTLQIYGSQYAGGDALVGDSLVSPGNCKDVEWWKKASPTQGVFIMYGEEEVFALEIKELIKSLEKADTLVGSKAEEGGIHAWPVASLFLSSSDEQRLKGLKCIVDKIWVKIPSK